MGLRRAIEIIGAGITLELSKVTLVKIGKRFFHLDELKNGTWRLTYGGDVIPDITSVQAVLFSDGKIVFEGAGTEVEMAKATPVRSTQNMIHLEEGKGGKWKLLYNGSHIENFSEVTELRIIREN